MRIVSQDGMYDLPYEMAIIHCEEFCSGKCMVNAIVSGAGGIIAEYSTKKKALKAMEMLRKQYKELETIKCFIQGNVKSVDDCKSTIIGIRDDHIFQFPKDEDMAKACEEDEAQAALDRILDRMKGDGVNG